jgi:hypothetical protein
MIWASIELIDEVLFGLLAVLLDSHCLMHFSSTENKLSTFQPLLFASTHGNIALKIVDKPFAIINFALHGGFYQLRFRRQCSSLKLY